MTRHIGMQKDLFTQLAEARTPEERAAIERRMRHAETGQDGERARVLDGLIVNGRDPYAGLRGRAGVVYEKEQPAETGKETRMAATTIEQPGQQQGGMSITEAAERTGAPAWRLRQLEDKGLIPRITRNSGNERVYSEHDVQAIEAALRKLEAGTAPTVASRAAAPPEKRKPPTVADRRYEIVYCPECRRQLSEAEYERETVDGVMTNRGGITTTTISCVAHKAPVAVKTEFVILVKPAGEVR